MRFRVDWCSLHPTGKQGAALTAYLESQRQYYNLAVEVWPAKERNFNGMQNFLSTYAGLPEVKAPRNMREWTLRLLMDTGRPVLLYPTEWHSFGLCQPLRELDGIIYLK